MYLKPSFYLFLLSSSFRIKEVMSKPLKGLCSGNFVGDECIFSGLLSLSRSRDSGSGDIGGDTDPPRLKLSSENNGTN